MSITNIMLEAFMQLGAAKQKTHAENISNANQPGYLAQDIKQPHNFLELVQTVSSSNPVSLRATSPMHLSGSKPRVKFKTVLDPTAGELKPNGNNVDLVDQTKKASQNQMLFDTALRAYKNSAGLVKIATGKGK